MTYCASLLYGRCLLNLKVKHQNILALVWLNFIFLCTFQCICFWTLLHFPLGAISIYYYLPIHSKISPVLLGSPLIPSCLQTLFWFNWPSLLPSLESNLMLPWTFIVALNSFCLWMQLAFKSPIFSTLSLSWCLMSWKRCLATKDILSGGLIGQYFST